MYRLCRDSREANEKIWSLVENHRNLGKNFQVAVATMLSHLEILA